jgi:hypothetical protein
MPKVPDEILALARTHHAQLIRLERDARVRVGRTLERALARIENDQQFRQYSDFEALQASEVEILARLTALETTVDLETALEEILGEGLLMAPSHAERELSSWLNKFGAESRPLNLASLGELSRQTVIERIPSSLATWGPDIARRVREELSAATATKTFAGPVIDTLQSAIGAERWKADRIFRTELFTAYNGAHLEGLKNARDIYDIPVRKSAIVTFDSRTGSDSYPMQGQVRDLEENFVDGDGRSFMHPPGRPNDREKEIPWIDDGEDLELVPIEEGIARVEAEKARNRELAGRAPVAPTTASTQAPRAPVDTFDRRREDLILDWTNSSNSGGAVAIKEAARTEFELDGAIWNPRGRAIPGDLDEMRSDLRRTYEDTQEHYRGVESVRLYRGVKTQTTIDGTVEAWTDDVNVAKKFAGRDGGVIYSDMDTRRILASVDAPGWRNGRYGNQREFLVLSDPPALRFGSGDWQSGPFNARDLDPNAIEAGPWGVLEDSSGRARLEHTPSGRTLLQGREYSKEGLQDAAKYLDRSGMFGANGLTKVGESSLDAALDTLRVQYAAAIPESFVAEKVNGVNAIDILGDRLGLINEKVKPAAPGVWSRRSFNVLRNRAEGYEAVSVRGVISGNFGIATEDGVGDGSFDLIHMKTGNQIFSGTRTFYSAGNRVPVDFGGFKLEHMKRLAEKLEDYVDPTTGAVMLGKEDDFAKIMAFIKNEDPKTAVALSIQETSDVDDWFKVALRKPDKDDDDDPFLSALSSKVVGGPSAGYAKQARESMKDRGAEVSKEVRFEKAVENRMEAIRRGQYNRHDDADFDRSVQEEAARRRAIDEKRRIEERKEEIGFKIDGEGRGFVTDALEKTLDRQIEKGPIAEPGDSPDEIRKKRFRAEAEAEFEAATIASERRKAEKAALKAAEGQK